MKNLALLFMLQVLLCSFGAGRDARVLGAFDEAFAIRNVNSNSWEELLHPQNQQTPNIIRNSLERRSLPQKQQKPDVESDYTPSPTFNVVDTRTNKLEDAILPACPPSTPTDSLPVSPVYPIVIKNEWEAEWLFELRLSLIISGQEFRKHLKETHRKAAL